MTLQVRIKSRAERQIGEAAAWWAENRPAAPGAVMADLRGALDLLVREPGLGSKVETSRSEVVRRLSGPPPQAAWLIMRLAAPCRCVPVNSDVRAHVRLDCTRGYIHGAGVRFRAAHAVLEVHLIGKRVLVVYDWMAFDLGAAARNLFCYDRTGEELWRAEDIGMGRTDAYTAVMREDPLWVGNFAGFDCRIDLATGKVLERKFTK